MSISPSVSTPLPQGWKRTQLRRLIDIRNGRDYKEVEILEGGYPVYGSGGEFRRASKFLHDGESILFGRKGTVDRPLYVDGKFWTVDTMYYAVPFEHVCARFLYYFSTTIPFKYYVTSTALPSITQSDLAAHPVDLPPLDEQQAIADYLDHETQKIDELITEQRGLIETLRERRQAVTYEVVSGLNLEIERWNTGSFIFPSLPNGWKEVSLRRVGKSKSGSGFPPSAQGMTGEDLQFFKVKHLAQADPRGVVHYADDTITRETAKQLGAQIFPPGTIAYAKVGAALMLGRIRTLGSEGCMDNNMAGFILSEGVESRFLQLAMSCIPFDYLVNPGAVPSLSDKNLMAMKIPLPPIDVQRKVSGEVDAQTSRIDELIAESEDLIALSQERRAALITAAVTGQIDVRAAA